MKPTTNNALTIISKPTTAAERAQAIFFDAIAQANDTMTNHPTRRIIWPTAATLNEFVGLYALEMGKLAAYLSIRAKHSSSGLYLMQQLLQSLNADQTAAQAAQHWRTIDRLEAEAEALRAHAAEMHTLAVEYGKITRRISSTAAEKADAAEQRSAAEAAEAAAITEARRKEAEAAAIERRLSDIVTTAAADAAQAATLAYLEHISLYAACRAAGQEIRAMQTEQGNGSSRTKVQRLTGAALAAAQETVWAYQSSGQDEDKVQVPFAVKGSNGATSGYWTLEYRNTNRFPSGYYKVMHYKTLGRLSLDAYATDAAEDSSEDAKAVFAKLRTMTTAEPTEAEQAFSNAKLNERQRNVISWATDDNNAASVAIGIAAIDRHMRRADTAAKAAPNKATAKVIRHKAAKRAEIVRTKARFAAACKLYKVPDSQISNGNFVKRIKAKIDEAAQQPTKAAEIQSAPKAIDRLGWCFAHGPMTAEPQHIVINWLEDYEQPQTITAEERAAQAQAEAEARAAEAEAKRPYMLFADYRRRLYQDRPSCSAYAALDAQAAARVYWEAMTKAEQWQLVYEAYAAEAAAAQATADRLTAAAMDKRSKAAQEAAAFWTKEAKRSSADAKRAAAQAKAARAEATAARAAKKAAQTEAERKTAQRAIDRAKAAESAAKAAKSAAEADTAACKARAAEAVQRAAEAAERDTATIRAKAAELAADAAALVTAAAQA